MVDVEWLKQNFKVANVPGLGRCIVIPIYKFKPEWDEELLQQGYECHAMNDCVYVFLGPETVEKPSPPAKTRRGRWSKEEDETLIKLWNQGLSYAEIAEQLPGRSEAAVRLRLERLRKAGRIEAKQSQKKEREQKVGSYEIAELKEQLSQIMDILDESIKLLGKLNCTVLMQGLQIKQLKGELTIPQNLWIHYANALLEDDRQFQQVFCKKVKQLLEVHK